jgi:hypothetical protein
MTNRRIYSYSIIEGNDVSETITDIQFKRVDGDEINKIEIEDLLGELEEFFHYYSPVVFNEDYFYGVVLIQRIRELFRSDQCLDGL